MKGTNCTKHILVLVSAVLLSACTLFTHKRQAGVIAEVNGHYLYERDLMALTIGLYGADSAASGTTNAGYKKTSADEFAGAYCYCFIH